LAVRRISEEDCCQIFRTGEKKFDCDGDGKPIELSFYLERDRKEGYLSFVYEEKGEILGILCIQITDNILYLSRIGIKEKVRTKGIGYHLHRHLMDIVQEKRIKLIYAKAHHGVFGWFEELGYLRVHEYEDPVWGKSADMMLLIG
jgi:N-acetylglutamate synthase-like GNAT family acetyltransferase